MVYCEEDHGFYELRLNCRAFNGYKRLVRENRRSLGDSPHIAFKAEVQQIFKKILAEHISASQVFNVLGGKAEVFEVFDNLLNSCHYSIACVVGSFAEEHIKVSSLASSAVFKESVSHGYLIEVNKHCQISVIHSNFLHIQKK